jgi:hypothetical protein
LYASGKDICIMSDLEFQRHTPIERYAKYRKAIDIFTSSTGTDFSATFDAYANRICATSPYWADKPLAIVRAGFRDFGAQGTFDVGPCQKIPGPINRRLL